MGAFSAAERRALARSLRAGGSPGCPACGGPLSARDVDVPGSVAYVRRRVWLFCPACKRTAAVDLERSPEGGGSTL